MTKALFGSNIEDKENVMVERNLVCLLTSQPSKYLKHVSPYKPKPPTPSKSIRSFFSSTARTIPSKVTKKDSGKAETGSMPKIFDTRGGALRRPFTDIMGEEAITIKRARKYFSSNDGTPCLASRFFLEKEQNNRDLTEDEEINKTVEKIEAIQDFEELIEERDEVCVDKGVNDGIDKEPDISETPPRSSRRELLPTSSDEIIPNSPVPSRIQCERDMTDSQTTDERPATPEERHPEHIVLPPSPPPSRSDKILEFSISTRKQRTPIVHPGMKKTNIARAMRKIFPDTPTSSPELSSKHNIVAQNWKTRFLHTSSSMPNPTDTISNRPTTPLRSPLFRRHILKTNKRSTNPRNTAMAMDNSESKLAVEQIEISPPRGKAVSLDQFRFVLQ